MYLILFALQHQATHFDSSILLNQGGGGRDWPATVPVFEDSWPEVIERLLVLCVPEAPPVGEEELELFPRLPTDAGSFRGHNERGWMRSRSVIAL